MNWPGHNNPSKQTPRHDPNGMPADEYAAQALSWLVDVTYRTILPALEDLKAGQTKIMETLATLQTAVTAEDTVIDSAVTLIQGLAAQVAALAPDQAAIDALAADIKGKSDALAAAVTANTPAV